MHDPQSSPDELSAFEAQLAALVPRAQLDRDRLMFAAGRRAGGRRLRVANRLLAGTSMALVAVVVAVVAFPRSAAEPTLAGEPPRAPSPRMAADDARPDTSGQPSVAMTPGPTHFRLRQMLAGGVDIQPAAPPRRANGTENDVERTPSDARDLLKQYLNSPTDRL